MSLIRLNTPRPGPDSSCPVRIALIVLLLVAAGCSSVNDEGKSGSSWFGTDSTLHTITDPKLKSNDTRPQIRYAATLQINRYEDNRGQDNPRLLGISTQLIRGVSGNQLLLDQDIADLVTSTIKTRFEAEGYQLLEAGDVRTAMFEVSGKISELNLNVKYRDEINIAIETTVKDLRNGALIWSGMVTEKHDRFAGVSGNNKDDVVAYLNKELSVSIDKSVAAVSAALMAAYPDLFNLTPGMQVIPGVSVYAVPTVVEPVPEQQPTKVGLLVVNTTPSRAKVYVDGVYFGLSPLRAEMEAGIHTIEVKLSDYRTVKEKVSVRKGDNTEMELRLER